MMPQKQTDISCDIAIMGGGAAGLTLGLLLADAGLEIILAEPYPPKAFEAVQPSGRTVALMNSSLHLIKACGVWDRLLPHAHPLQTMRIIDGSILGKDPVTLSFPASDIGQAQFGFNIPNGLLRAALYERAATHSHIKILPARFQSSVVTSTHIAITMDQGPGIRARVLIGADGRNSAVRQFAGIPAVTKDYQQSAITCLINHSRAHESISTEFHRPAGPFALVPLPGHQSSVVWVERPEKAEALMRLKKQEFTEALQKQSRDILGAVTLETPPECWPLASLKATALTAPRTALLAEAAHVISPITAQGLNLSLRDVASLSETLIDAARIGLDIGSEATLTRYAKRRSLDIETRVQGVNRFNSLVSTDTPTIKAMRRAGLKGLEYFPGLKNIAMHAGLAPTLDMGRLLKGEAL